MSHLPLLASPDLLLLYFEYTQNTQNKSLHDIYANLPASVIALSLSIHKPIHHIHGLSRVSQCYAPIKNILKNLLIFLKRNFTLRKRPLSKPICFGRIKAQLIHGGFSVLSSWRLNDGQTFVRLENCVYSVYMAVGFEDGRVVRWCPICWESQVCFRGLPSIQLASLGASGLLTSLF